jgi:hypothetical protein
MLPEELIKDAGLGLPRFEQQQAALYGLCGGQAVDDCPQFREKFEVPSVNAAACCPQVDRSPADAQ